MKGSQFIMEYWVKPTKRFAPKVY